MKIEFEGTQKTVRLMDTTNSACFLLDGDLYTHITSCSEIIKMSTHIHHNSEHHEFVFNLTRHRVEALTSSTQVTPVEATIKVQ